MLKLTPIPGISYAKKETYSSFVNSWSPNLTKENLGVCSNGVDNIYGIPVGDQTKPTIFVVAGIHGGHEFSSQHWVVQFAQYVQNPNLLPDYHGRLLRKLKTKLGFYFIPTVNPDGYTTGKRGNVSGVDINRNFDSDWANFEAPYYENTTKGSAPFSEVETIAVRDKVLEKLPIAFIDCHTVGPVSYGIVFDASPNASRYNPLMVKDLSASLVASLPSAQLKIGNPGPSPRSDHWASKQASKNGGNTFGLCIEPGSNETVEMQSSMGMTTLLLICVYISHWFTHRTLRNVTEIGL